MRNLDQLLQQRNLPDIMKETDGRKISDAEAFDRHRQYLRDVLQSEEYGRIPPAPRSMHVRTLSTDADFADGRATLARHLLTVSNGLRFFSFPFSSVIPNDAASPIPAFVHINFSSDIPHEYQPTEQIIGHGYAIFTFFHNDVTPDVNDFSDEGARFLCPDRSVSDASGKIAMWAWAAMRIMDYIVTLPRIDHEQIAVIGHSRLGKTALLAAAFDERFRYAISNNSGCSGAALTRGKRGETYRSITSRFPHWFCPEYLRRKSPEALPFDQHFLLSLIAPRHVLVGSALEDDWADPISEFLSLYSVNPVYELYGRHGLITPDRLPTANVALSDGDAHYHIRAGRHYLSLTDWLYYLRYIDRVRRTRSNL